MKSWYHPHLGIAKTIWNAILIKNPETEPPPDWNCDGMIDCSHEDSKHAPEKCCPGHGSSLRPDLFPGARSAPNTTDAVLLKDRCNVWVVLKKYIKAVPELQGVALDAMKPHNRGPHGPCKRCSWKASNHYDMVSAAVNAEIDHILKVTDGCANLHGNAEARAELDKGAWALIKGVSAMEDVWNLLLDMAVERSGYQRPLKGIYQPFSVDPDFDLDPKASTNGIGPVGWTTSIVSQTRSSTE